MMTEEDNWKLWKKKRQNYKLNQLLYDSKVKTVRASRYSRFISWCRHLLGRDVDGSS